jgi:glycosyltransferase involved in cell wall biosynthesis
MHRGQSGVEAEKFVSMKPLVSILIAAYNSEKWIGYTLRSAIAQTWPRKEIIVVNDGSTDRTPDLIREFASQGVAMISTENRGMCAAQNLAYQSCSGDYIQWLDSDDILASDKIERQLGALRATDSNRIVLSSPYARFYYRTRAAKFVHNSLCGDLSPLEWMLRKLSQNLFMQNATWLVSRELTEAAGPWDTRLHFDQDGEYFARVLLASEGTRFVPDTGIYYRISPSNRVSYIGKCNKKRDSLLLAMKLHIQYIRLLEDSDRVRQACLNYLRAWYDNFYPDRPDIVVELQKLAAELGGSLEPPRLRWKYAWLRPVLGWDTAKLAQRALPDMKSTFLRYLDRLIFKLEEGRSKAAEVNSRSAAQTSI